jgi:hypothetical protein
MRNTVTKAIGLSFATAAMLTGGLVTATQADAVGIPTCPSGRACLYQNPPQAGDPAEFYHYGAYNLSDVLGYHLFRNAQTGGAKAYVCTGYNGTGTCTNVPAGTAANINFTPINSIYLHA